MYFIQWMISVGVSTERARVQRLQIKSWRSLGPMVAQLWPTMVRLRLHGCVYAVIPDQKWFSFSACGVSCRLRSGGRQSGEDSHWQLWENWYEFLSHLSVHIISLSVTLYLQTFSSTMLGMFYTVLVGFVMTIEALVRVLCSRHAFIYLFIHACTV